MPYKNKEVQLAAIHAWQLTHREAGLAANLKYRRSHRETAAASRAKRREAMTAFVQEQKAGKVCLKCGESDISRLVFHHIDPATKLFTIGSNGDGRPIQRIAEEIAKCVVWCRTCHATHHRNQQTKSF